MLVPKIMLIMPLLIVPAYALEPLALSMSYDKSFAKIVYLSVNTNADSLELISDGYIIYVNGKGWDRTRFEDKVILKNRNGSSDILVILDNAASILNWTIINGNDTSNGSLSLEKELSLIVPILNVEDPARDISLIKQYLKPGDIVVFPPSIYKHIKELKQELPGLKIGTGGTSIEPLLKGINRFPEDIDYVTYDYEPDFTPEFTSDQNKSIEYFSQLFNEAHKYNKQLIIVPVYVYGKDWDWGEVAKYTDIIIVQVQNFQRGFVGPDEFKPTNIGKDLKSVTKELVDEIRSKAPDTKIYLQIGFTYGPSSNDVYADIVDIKDLGIDGIAVWYNPGTSQVTAKIDELTELLSMLRSN